MTDPTAVNPDLRRRCQAAAVEIANRLSERYDRGLSTGVDEMAEVIYGHVSNGLVLYGDVDAGPVQWIFEVGDLPSDLAAIKMIREVLERLEGNERMLVMAYLEAKVKVG